ncbi:MAG: hypothetical protein C4521_07275 [Actinobacteria bacterium]|nr:MAG: hypothetical protein C4521_07275 [Actinomycetota bacterium]
MAITRRTFVKSMSAGAAALALEAKLNLLTSGIQNASAATTYSHYVCGMCSGGCKARAKVVDGVVAELQGENASQTSRGRLCVKGLSAIRMYKSPNRVKKPLIRTNPQKGPGVDPGWREASWNEAMALVVDKMKTAIQTHGAKSIVMQMRPSPGDITNRLAVALGTPNDMCHHDTCYTSHDVAWAVTAHAADIAGGWSTYTETTDYTLDDVAGTITRVGGGAIAAHAVVYAVYVGTDGKRYTDFVEFDTDTKSLSQPINRGAKTPAVVSKMTKKSGRNWTHDIARSKYILSFGWDQPGKGKNMMAQDYLYAVNNGAKAVVFDPRLSPTASIADRTGGEWIQIKPGTDLAVMFAMMKVIVGNGIHADDGGNGRWNKSYCGTYSSPAAGVSGFPQFIDHIKTNAFETGAELPVGDGSPADVTAVLAWAEGKSGVAAADIRRIAEEFSTAANWPAYVPGHKRDAGGPNYRNSFEVAHSVILLNTLVGSIDRLGGGIKQRQHSTKDLSWICPAPDIHLSTYERIDHLNRFPIQSKMNKGSQQYIADAILSGDPYPIDVLFVRKYNILSQPDPQKWIEALNQVFVVCCEIQMSEMAQMADVVLPEVVFLEGRGLGKAEYFSLWPQLMVTGGTVPKLYPHTSDATVAGSGPKGWRDILLAAFPKAFGDWVNPETGYAVRESFRLKPGGTYDGTGTFIYDDSRGSSKAYDDEMLKKLGTDIGDGSLASGGWNYIASAANFPEGLYPGPASGESYNLAGGTYPVDPKTFTPSYGTASKPVQMYSQALDAYGYDPLPVWKERRQEKSGSFDLYMVTDHPSPHIHSTTQDADFNNELYDENVLWINPVTAAAKGGIVTGDQVDVEARSTGDLGSGRTIRMKAFVTDRIKPDVICIPHGFGHWSRDFHDYAKKGGNDGEMVPVPPISEILAENTPQPGCRMNDVVVKVTKVV